MMGNEPGCAHRTCIEWVVSAFWVKLGGLTFMLWLCPRHSRFLRRVPGLELKEVKSN
jgi:hypothetical protein